MQEQKSTNLSLEQRCTEVLSVELNGVCSCAEAATFECANCGRRVCSAHVYQRNSNSFLPMIVYCHACDLAIPRSDLRG